MRFTVLVMVAIACGTPKSPSNKAPERSAPADAGLDAPVAPVAPTLPKCPAKPNPKACPATEPNINAACKPNRLECTYGAGCCPTVYACNQLKFEARFTSCSK